MWHFYDHCYLGQQRGAEQTISEGEEESLTIPGWSWAVTTVNMVLTQLFTDATCPTGGWRVPQHF